MELAVGTSRVTEKGQVTIPAEIRKNQGLEQGANVVFVEVDEGILIKPEKNFKEIFRIFQKRAEELGLTREELAKEVKEVRRKRWEEYVKNRS